MGNSVTILTTIQKLAQTAVHIIFCVKQHTGGNLCCGNDDYMFLLKVPAIR